MSFTTQTVHGVWYDFKGTVERGPGKNPGDEAYYLLKGTLIQNTTDANKKTSAKSRDVISNRFRRIWTRPLKSKTRYHRELNSSVILSGVESSLANFRGVEGPLSHKGARILSGRIELALRGPSSSQIWQGSFDSETASRSEAGSALAKRSCHCAQDDSADTLPIANAPRSGTSRQRVVSSVRAAPTCASSVSDSGTRLGADHYAGRRGGLFRIHHPADLRPARVAEQSGGPQSQRFPATAAHSERSQHSGAGHARHAGQQRALSSDRMVGAIPARAGGLERRSALRRSRLRLPTALPNSASI